MDALSSQPSPVYVQLIWLLNGHTCARVCSLTLLKRTTGDATRMLMLASLRSGGALLHRCVVTQAVESAGGQEEEGS